MNTRPVYRVLIIGDKHRAALEADRRSVPLVFRFERAREDLRFETYGDVPASHLDRLVQWYGEPPTVPPFPTGTLLHYARIDA